MARTAKLEYENFAASTLDGAIIAGDAFMDVQPGDAAAYFPASTDFNIRLGDDAQGYEIVKVTNIAGDTFTITRAQEGTGALPFTDGTAVWLVVSKEYIEQLQRPLEIIEDGYQKNLLPESFLMEWGSNGDNWPGTSFTADSAALDNAQTYHGTYSLKVVADNAELWVCSAGIGSYNIPLTVGQKYIASMYCREAAGVGLVQIIVRQSDGDSFPSVGFAADNTGWMRVYVPFIADSPLCNIQVRNGHANNKTYYCDAFQLEMVDGTVSVPSDYCPPAAAQTVLQDVDIEGDATVEGTIIANGDNIHDSGGASGITFDGAGNTAVDGNLDVTGDITLDGGDINMGADATLWINAAAGRAVGIELGDAAGATNFVVFDSSPTQVFAVSSDADVVVGANSTIRGTLRLWDGPGGNTPGYIAIGSPNGTVWYLFVEDDGTVKYHNAIPTLNADGNAVGDQTD